MKVHKIHLERFKRFSDNEISFLHPGTQKPLDLIVLVGDNGSGKSSILQAIAATLGSATGQIRSPSELSWPGFQFESLSDAHRGFAEVTLTIGFSQDERKAVQEYFEESDFRETGGVMPADYPDVRLVMTNDPSRDRPVVASEGKEAYFQFRGREYAFNMLRRGVRKSDIFRRVGGLMSYTEQRTAASLAPAYYDKSIQPDSLSEIRKMISNWDASSSTLGQSRINTLKELYAKVFPGRRFSRVGDTFGAESPDIFFSDGHYEYEIAEFSGGERAIFPILLDFINWGVHNSVILIDELELHLHPPLQQTLMVILPTLGENNQFIITTHSDAVFDIIPSESIRRIRTGFNG